MSARQPAATPPGAAIDLGLFLLSAAALTFEINLTRLFSVAQFYHFAFMIVSLALLGYGVSGTALALAPALRAGQPRATLGWLALAMSLSSLGAYALTNWLPFDSFSLVWDGRQFWILAAHYAALSSPFFFCGLAVGCLLSAAPLKTGRTYAVNLLGSACGCLIALPAPGYLGGEGTVVLSSGLAALAAVVCLTATKRLAPTVWLALTLCDLGLRLIGRPTWPLLDLRLSPYKGLAYALQYPGARSLSRQWNSVSRVDVVRSAGIRSVPGLSYRYLETLPLQDGLLVDGDDLSPILAPGADPTFAAYLPAALAFRLRPAAEALVLEPRGGLDVFTALAGGARRVTAVESNALIVAAAGPLYTDPRVRVVIEADRSYLRRATDAFDVILLSLISAYHPIQSGAYSLAEDYRYTVEAFQAALARLKPDGVLVTSRWLQTPPSECLRAFALAVTALDRAGVEATQNIVAFRSYNLATLLVKNSGFTAEELSVIREFTRSRAFDLIYAPDLRPDEVNRYNVLAEPIYTQAFLALLAAQPREAFYSNYAFDVAPPTDDRPFFGHFFKWSQAGRMWAALGKTWQPFGGAGYFALLALLGLAVLLAAGLILLPAVVARRLAPLRPPSPVTPEPARAWALLYFGLIGLAYLLVEIPLIQRFILFLGHPAYALTAVIFAVLLFSGIGSCWSERLPWRRALALLVVLLAGAPPALPFLFDLALGLPLGGRLALTLLSLAPIAFLMGAPFPAGIRGFGKGDTDAGHIAWAWAVNGAASVIAAVLAALLSLSLGFNWVLRLGAVCYAGAWLIAARAAPGPSHLR